MPLCCSQFSTIWIDTWQSKAFSIPNKSRNNLPEKHGFILYWSSPWYFLFSRDRILLKINLYPVSDWNTKLFQPYFKPGPKFHILSLKWKRLISLNKCLTSHSKFRPKLFMIHNHFQFFHCTHEWPRQNFFLQ